MTIKSTTGQSHAIQTARTTTIEELKQEFSFLADIPVEQIKLVYSGRVLKDEFTVEFYGE